MRWDSADFRDWLRQPAAWAILVVGVVLSLFAWRALTLEVRHAARASFDAAVGESLYTVRSRLHSYRIMLYGLQGLFNTGTEIDRPEFRRYFENLASAGSYGQVRSFSFARYVPQVEKSSFEDAVRRDTRLHPAGYPRFSIKPAGERREYVVVELFEPFRAEQAGFGLDLFAEPVRRAAVEKARDRGELIASAPFTLLSSPAGETATSLRLAVYRHGAILASLDSRRRAFAGVVSATFLIRDLVEDILARQASTSLRLQIRDGAEVLYESVPSGGAPQAFESTATLDVGDRVWRLRFSAPPGRFLTAGDVAMPWLALLGGIAITVLLAGLVGSLATSSRRAQRLAATMTHDLLKSQAELAQSQQRTQKLIETLPNPVFFTGRDGRYLGVNEAWEKFFGTPRIAIIGRTVEHLYAHHAEVGRRLAAMDEALWQQPGTQVHETTITLPSGETRDVMFYKATFTGPDERVAGLIASIIDVTQQKHAEQRLRMEHAVTRVLAEADSISAGLQGALRAICEAEGWDCGRYFTLDVRAGVLRFAESWTIPEQAVADFVEQTRDMVFGPGDGLAGKVWQTGEPIWTADISGDTRATRRYTSDFGMRGAFVFPVISGGQTLGVIAFTSRVVREPDPRLLDAVRAIGSQIGQFLIRKQAEEALRFVATHDSLTRLPNRVMFGQRLEHALSQAERYSRRLAVLFIDLDRFKVINDTLGHDAGDALLRDVARRLVENLRASDTVARLGGDEFVVLLEEISDPMFVTAVAQKLLAVLAEPFTLAGREYHVTGSIGASTYPEDGSDVQELLKDADIAMYRAKDQGRNAFRFYAEELNLALGGDTLAHPVGGA